MRVTLKDIASRSGFSITTVSRALAGYDDVSEKTRQFITDIADELSYQPNQIARQLQGNRTNTIGFIMPARGHQHDDDDFFSLLLKGITHAAARRHLDVLVSAAQDNVSEMETYQRIVGGHRVDGVILARTYENDPRIQYLKSVNHPFVVHGRNAPGHISDFPYIDVDSQMGIRLLVEHFIERGHQHIGIILPPQKIAFTGYRLAGYRAGLENAGIPYRESYASHADFTHAGGEKAARRLLEYHPPLTAIIGCNDWMALGAMTAIQQCGLKVGLDIAVGGYDGIPAAAHASPALTTIQQPIYDLGELLTARLMQLMNESPSDDHQLLIEPQLIVRESSGPVRS